MLSARTASFKFTQDIDSMEYWTALAQTPTVGKFIASPYAMGENSGAYCNTIVVIGDSHKTSLKITTDFMSAYPQYTSGGVSLEFNAVDITIDTEVFSSAVNFNLQKGATLYFNKGNAFGALVMKSGASSAIFAQGSTFLNNNGSTEIGSNATTDVQKVKIQGSTSNITFRNLRLIGTVDTSAASIKGGAIEFHSDASGISTLKTYGVSGADFSGVVIVDFSELLWDESWGESKTFNLLTTTEQNLADPMKDWVENSDVLGEIVGATGVFSSDNKNLYVTIDKIPEPSTYAFIFGSLVFAFVTYRRRK